MSFSGNPFSPMANLMEILNLLSDFHTFLVMLLLRMLCYIRIQFIYSSHLSDNVMIMC